MTCLCLFFLSISPSSISVKQKIYIFYRKEKRKSIDQLWFEIKVWHFIYLLSSSLLFNFLTPELIKFRIALFSLCIFRSNAEVVKILHWSCPWWMCHLYDNYDIYFFFLNAFSSQCRSPWYMAARNILLNISWFTETFPCIFGET